MLDIGIIIVAYNPSVDAFVTKIKAYELATHNIIIVNNGIKLNEDFKYAKIVNLNKNMGIAYAQNKGIDVLTQMGVNLAFLLDQDTQLDSDYFKNMLGSWNELYSNDENICILSPIVFDREISQVLPLMLLDKNLKLSVVRDISDSKEFYKNTLPISSGILVNIDKVKKIHGINNKLFIDWVDFELDLAVLENGMSIYTNSNIKINHAIGKKTSKNFFGKTINPSNSPIFREYYFFRNGIFMTRKAFLKKFVLRALFIRCISIIFETKKVARVSAMIRGIRDGTKLKKKSS